MAEDDIVATAAVQAVVALSAQQAVVAAAAIQAIVAGAPGGLGKLLCTLLSLLGGAFLKGFIRVLKFFEGFNEGFRV